MKHLKKFNTEEECQEWCDKTNAEMKKEEEDLYEESLEEKMLKRKLKMYGETLSMSQTECVIDAMKEVTLQRKLGNWTNKPK